MKPNLQILNRQELNDIHEASLTILAGTGMAIDSKSVRDILCYNGAKQGKDNIIHFPEAMVTEAITAIEPDLVLGARDPNRNITLTSSSTTVFSTTGFSPMIADYRTELVRMAEMRDLIDFAKVADFYDEVGFFLPPDVEYPGNPTMVELESLYQCFFNTAKHIQCSCTSGKTAHYLAALGKIVSSNKEGFKKQPLFSCNVMPISPLTLGSGAAEAIVSLAAENVPIAPFSTPLANSSAPATVAGTLALSNAENLGVLTIMKAVNKKSRMIYSADTCSMNFKTGVINYDSPEYLLFSLANQQLADYYQLTSCVAHDSAESLPDTAAAADAWKERILFNYMSQSALSLWLGSQDSGLTSSLLNMVYAIYLIREVKEIPQERFLAREDELMTMMTQLMHGSVTISPECENARYLERHRYQNPFADVFDETILKNQLREIITDILENHHAMVLPEEKVAAMNELMREAEADLQEEDD